MSSKATSAIAPGAFHLERRSADEYRLWHGEGEQAVYCGHITYDPRHGWDAYDMLAHRYLPSGPFGEGDEAVERAHKALRRAIMKRGNLDGEW
jgi:hypothetical protein